MMITANRDDLLLPLQQVGGVVERRQTLPILANILINVRNHQMMITATDLEVELKTTASVSCDGEADFTLPARKLLDICKALPEGADMTLSLEGEKAVLKSGRGRYTLGVLPASDYPAIEPAAASESFSLPQNVLKGLVERTQFAMAQQDVRYYLNGMLLEIQPGRIRTVATDGHRLAMSEVEYDGEQSLQVILPRKAVLELSRLLSGEDDVHVQISNNHARFQVDQTIFTTKLIDGRFPDYERVMPSADAKVAELDRAELRQALSRASILSNEKYRGIRFKIDNNQLELLAHNPEQEEAEEVVEVEFPGEPLTIGFNVGYLLDVLNTIDTPRVRLSLVDANSSCLIRSQDSDDSRYVVMPMRL